MTRHRCYLVDDEELALAALNRALSDSGRVDVVGLSTDPAAAIEEIQRLEPEVLFLDIHMPEIDGFEMLSRLERQPFVIFTTAYDQHALRAFEENSIDYLLKPIDKQRLARALDKLQSRLAGGVPQNEPRVEDLAFRVAGILKSSPSLRRVAIQAKQGVSLLDVDRVTHFISEHRYCYACTETGRFPLSLSLADLETRLDPAQFVRIHRSAIVNLNFVVHLSSWFGGRLFARLRDPARTELTVSRDHVRKLRQTLGI